MMQAILLMQEYTSTRFVLETLSRSGRWCCCSRNMAKAEFKSGQINTHKLFNYRGVILKVDQIFKLTDEWYEIMAKSKPPKDKPWYHVLVHEKNHTTYVAERNLYLDKLAKKIIHPVLPFYFTEIKDGVYQKTLNWEGEFPLPLDNIGEA